VTSEKKLKRSVIMHYAYKQEGGWACSVCGTPYESKWDATICCAYTKRTSEDEEVDR